MYSPLCLVFNQCNGREGIFSEPWLAPGIYTDLTLYAPISALRVTIYVAYMVYI
ncbi:MAG: hypothetical protein QXQ17_03525 [Desulfurococcaceae archaeon]